MMKISRQIVVTLFYDGNFQTNYSCIRLNNIVQLLKCHDTELSDIFISSSLYSTNWYYFKNYQNSIGFNGFTYTRICLD